MGSEVQMQQLADLRSQEASAAKTTLLSLFDEGSFTELDPFAVSDSVVAGFGTVDGNPVYAFAQNMDAQSGAVTGQAVAKIKKVYDLATKTGAPVVGMYDSCGAKLDDGFAALSAYGEWMQLANNISGVVPQLSLVLGPCAGTAAMIACSSDIVVMSKKAELFLNAPSVTGENADADAAVQAGVAHIVAEDTADAVSQAKKLLSMLPSNNLSIPPLFDFAEPSAVVDGSLSGCALIQAVCDEGSAVCLQKGFAPCVATALATVAGNVTGFVATAKEQIGKNGAAKAARFVRMCDAFGIPVVTFVSATGFDKTAAADALRAAATLAHAYAEATTAKVAVVSGESCGSLHMAMAGKGAASDLVIGWAGASVSPLSAETSVELFWHEKLAGAGNLDAKRTALAQEYKDTEASVFAAAKAGSVDTVIAPAETRSALVAALDMLAGKRVSNAPKKHGNMPL